MKVICNASPIINLSLIGKLDLIQSIFRRIIITQAVYDEISVLSEFDIGYIDLTRLDWIEVKPVQNQPLLKLLKTELDEGESETIALASAISADLVILDEKNGRKKAETLGLKITGILGLLVLAKERGLIEDVKPQMDKLINIAGFWINPDLYEKILLLANEMNYR